ncbi:MAG: urease accessory protein UreE [Gammaproteobacteria bacterium]|nr:MAG: urease accessory protein UreE [Gammaproteobacteria bacterium]
MHVLTRLERGAAAAHTTLTLAQAERARSRGRVRLDDGRSAMLHLPRGTLLRDGDVLGSDDGLRVRVVAAAEAVSTVPAADAEQLARLAYHLGNRHVPLQIGAGWLRYAADDVLDDMVRRLGGDPRREQAPFEPESGPWSAAAGRHEHD